MVVPKALDSKLDFSIHIDHKINRKHSACLPRRALLNICKSFIRPHLDQGDILYDKPDNQNFESKIEKAQYKARIAITGAIQGTPRKRFYDEMPFRFNAIKRKALV